MLTDSHTTTTWEDCRRCKRLLHKSFAGLCPECRNELRRYIAATKQISLNPNCWSEHDRELIDQEIDAERYWPRPIPVSERLPEDFALVIGYCRIHGQWEEAERHPFGIEGVKFDPEYHGWIGDCECRFTHWLPTPPKPE